MNGESLIELTSHFEKLSGRNREERDNQSIDVFPRIGFAMSCFCPITIVTEPSIIPSTSICSLEEVRHKMLYMEPEARAFSDSRFPNVHPDHSKKEEIKK